MRRHRARAIALLGSMLVLCACGASSTVSAAATSGAATHTVASSTATATGGPAPTATATHGSGGGSHPTPTVTTAPVAHVFVQTASASNRSGDYTIISSPACDGTPHALLLVSPIWNPGGHGGTYDNHAIGVWYTGTHWAIFHQDLTPIPVGAAFNVWILSPSVHGFVQLTTSSNHNGDGTRIDRAGLNGQPFATLLVTPTYNPGGGGGTYDNHPVGVYYDGSRWEVFNEDGATMPIGAAFNVVSLSDVAVSAGGGFIQTASPSNTNSNTTVISDFSGNPAAQVFFTPSWNPAGSGGTYNPHNTGVWYTTTGHWSIFNQDLVAMPDQASFNYWVWPAPPLTP